MSDRIERACQECGSLQHHEEDCLKRKLCEWMGWSEHYSAPLDHNFIAACRSKLSPEQQHEFLNQMGTQYRQGGTKLWRGFFSGFLFFLANASPTQQARAILESVKQPPFPVR